MKRVLLLLILLLGACIMQPQETQEQVDAPVEPVSGTEQVNEESSEQPVQQETEQPKEQPTHGTSNTVILETTKGTIEVELNEKAAPITVKNFLRYVEEGHYEGTVFHRVIKGFMVQGGGFTLEGQKPTHDPIPIESNNGLKNNKGTIAMARTSDPNSASAQFFINTVDNDFLNYAPGSPGYTVFGEVTKGMDVVEAIEQVATGNSPMPDWPREPITITKATRK